MNVINNKIFLGLILFLSLTYSSYSASFNVCSISFDEPWFEAKDSSNNTLLLIDKDGDLYALGEDHTLDNKESNPSLELGENFHFNSQTSKYSQIQEDISSISSEGIIIQTTQGNSVAQFSGSTIYLKGKAAVEGGQAACANDGNYCSGEILENRDYFCDITESRSGACSYNVISTQNCNNNNGWVCLSGNVRAYADYTCSGSSCAVGSTSNYYDCDVNDGWTCSGNYRVYRDYSCSSGGCSSTTTSSQYCQYGCSGGSCSSCSAEPTSTTCSGKCGYQTNNCGSTIYCGSCSTPVNGVCGSASGNLYSSYPSSGHCSSGSHNPTDTNGADGTWNWQCIGADGGNTASCSAVVDNKGPAPVEYTYSWNTASWGACSTSCGTGTQTRSVWCQRSDGATVSDSYCSGAKPATSQSCSLYSSCTYSWQTGSWSACSPSTCGYQSRSVWCQRSDGATVSGSYCSGAKPIGARECNVPSGKRFCEPGICVGPTQMCP